MTEEIQKPESDIFIAIKQIIESARAKSYRATNNSLLESYWQIG